MTFRLSLRPSLPLAAATLLSLSALCGAVEPTGRGVPVLTRTVKQFSTLENAWLDAARRHDGAALGTLLADDFEQRSADLPGRPTTREEALARMLAEPPRQDRLEQMAAHEFGADLVVVSFLWQRGADGKSADGKGADARASRVFVVDTWKRTADGWRVAVRYASPAVAGAPLVPWAQEAAPTIEKHM